MGNTEAEVEKEIFGTDGYAAKMGFLNDPHVLKHKKNTGMGYRVIFYVDDAKKIMMQTHIMEDERDLKIEGFITNQNVQSTKNSNFKKPLKVKSSGLRTNASEMSDPGTTLQHNMIRQGSFRRPDRKIPKYQLMAKNDKKLLDEKYSY